MIILHKDKEKTKERKENLKLRFQKLKYKSYCTSVITSVYVLLRIIVEIEGGVL